MDALLHFEVCMTYLHRMKFQSCYAVTSTDTKLYETERPARDSRILASGFGNSSCDRGELTKVSRVTRDAV